MAMLKLVVRILGSVCLQACTDFRLSVGLSSYEFLIMQTTLKKTFEKINTFVINPSILIEALC